MAAHVRPDHSSERNALRHATNANAIAATLHRYTEAGIISSWTW